MAIQVSPGINISEIDLTQIVPAVSTTDAAIAGVFRWGPVNTPTLVTSETDLVAQFGQPFSTPRTTEVADQWSNSETWFTARNFLSYSDSLFVTRVVASPDGPEDNPDSYTDATDETKQATSTLFNAKYVGKLGNSLRTSYCKSGSFDAFARKETLVLNVNKNTATISGFISLGSTQLVAEVGDNIILSTEAVMTVAEVKAGETDHTGSVSKTFNAGTGGDVTLADNTITIADHGFVTDDLVQYDVGTGEEKTFANPKITDAVGGISFDDPDPDLAVGDKVTISGTVDGAEGAIDPGSYLVGATNGTGTATLTDLNGTAIATTAGTVVIGSVNASTTVKFISASNAVTGLLDDRIYAVTRVDNNIIKLRLEHNSSKDITLIALGIGGAHSLTKIPTFKVDVKFTTDYKTSIENYDGTYSTQWGDADLFDADPVADTMHVVVRDNDGRISGLADTILETHSNVSWLDGKLNEDSSTNYITDLLEQQSNWIQCTDAQADLIKESTVTYDSITDMTTGSDGMDEATMRIGDMAKGYDTFADKTQLDISFVLQGKPRGNTALANYIIDNVCEVRKDCVAFISPELTDMTAQLIVAFAGQINASNYAFIDSGYKYQLDKYADRYRWVPLNGDIAGLCARTDDTRDPWFSPAGYQRGEIRNTTKLRFNANQSQRDLMYKANVNPVISRPGTGGGHILFGDKTNAGIASAFDRINVRRLFIVLEKSIEVAAKATLFEFNDEFTRAQFKNMIEPFLRDVQGRRGIYDFMVVADETNNTPEVIDSNRFVGDIYIKPVRSINFIQLNFVAVRSGVEFTEVVGKF